VLKLEINDFSVTLNAEQCRQLAEVCDEATTSIATFNLTPRYRVPHNSRRRKPGLSLCAESCLKTLSKKELRCRLPDHRRLDRVLSSNARRPFGTQSCASPGTSPGLAYPKRRSTMRTPSEDQPVPRTASSSTRDRTAGKDLATLARRINTRERRSRAEQLAHALAQGQDLLEARQLVGRGWRRWVRDNLSFTHVTAWRYMEYARSVTSRNTPPEEKWDLWQRLQGNAPANTADGDSEDRSPSPANGRPGHAPGGDEAAAADWCLSREEEQVRAWLLRRRQTWPATERDLFPTVVQRIAEDLALGIDLEEQP
jgi:hypothetical protein